MSDDSKDLMRCTDEDGGPFLSVLASGIESSVIELDLDDGPREFICLEVLVSEETVQKILSAAEDDGCAPLRVSCTIGAEEAVDFAAEIIDSAHEIDGDLWSVGYMAGISLMSAINKRDGRHVGDYLDEDWMDIADSFIEAIGPEKTREVVEDQKRYIERLFKAIDRRLEEGEGRGSTDQETPSEAPASS